MRSPLPLCLLPLLLPASLSGVGAPPATDPLPEPVARELARSRERGASAGLLARFLDGPVIAAHEPFRPFVPASTMKLLTTACALERLGPAHSFATRFLARSGPDASGKIDGPLWVQGGGDPLLRAEDLWAAARELAALGVRRVEGPLVGDDLLLEPAGRPESWPSGAGADPYDAAQGALSLAWNAVELIVRPGPRAGAPAAVDLFPVSAGTRIVNRVRTAEKTRVQVAVSAQDDGRARLTVRGTVAAGGPPYRRWVRLADPSAAALAAFREIAPAAGIAIAGETRSGRAPKGAVPLLVRRSRPLAEIVRAVNKYSLNGAAELLLRALAAEEGVPRASTRDGLARLERCLTAWSVPRDGLRLADGSGLSPADRLSAAALVAVLRAAWRRPDWRAEFVASLPRAGEDGSLAHRLPRLRGRLRAKTGSFRGAAGLAGYGWTEAGRPFAFAVLVNGPRSAAAPVGTADRLALAIAEAAERTSER